jgi:Lysyl oxidase/Bacterial Ig domain
MGRLRFPTRSLRAAALACALCLLPAAETGAALPDLVADPPGPLSAAEVYDDGAGPRLLVRFNGYVHNRGPGPLEIRAGANNGGWMGDVRQRIYRDGGGFDDAIHNPAPQVIFETDDSHNHWHLKHIARYSLWNSAGTAEVAPAQKAGFCLVDSQRVEAPDSSPPGYVGSHFCEQNRPAIDSVMMGLSGGWRDVYGRSLAFQWVDVSDVAPGVYRVRAEIDPEGTIFEANEFNPPAFAAEEAVVPGYGAVNVSQGAATGPRQVHLRATNVGEISRAPQFKIVTPPAHGSLDRPAGEWFDGGSVRYTPAPGFSGPDSFTFAARDPASGFPRNPRPAVAALQGTGGTLVTIAGAPESLRTGASAQLSAVVQNGSPEVSWSVDGAAGGNQAVGTVSAGGLYRAPDEVPPAGQVRVSARSASGALGDAVIRILEAPARRAAPDVPGAVRGSRKRRNLLSPLRFARHGRRLLVSLRSARAGLVVVRAQKDGRLIGHCRARVAARQRMTCAIRLDRLGARAALVCRLPRTSGLRLPRMHVSATLYVKGKKRAVRRAPVRN